MKRNVMWNLKQKPNLMKLLWCIRKCANDFIAAKCDVIFGIPDFTWSNILWRLNRSYEQILWRLNRSYEESHSEIISWITYNLCYLSNWHWPEQIHKLAIMWEHQLKQTNFFKINLLFYFSSRFQAPKPFPTDVRAKG